MDILSFVFHLPLGGKKKEKKIKSKVFSMYICQVQRKFDSYKNERE